ncbi:MAG: methylenetetrahydrofolate reductase [Chloroflexi bacterium]|nr:methylenetetrahydrofolate reductase [Chloroflexota bacterium]MCL5110819.1 methylenetetrahydrofolate reductase [Chloroflexota bacterium]
MKSGSNLESVLESGRFAVTAELGPPKGTGVKAIYRKVEQLKPAVDAVNLTDNQTAITRMCSLATSALVRQAGVEPVMQITCRDRNRIGIQSDVLGAVALGIRNILCLSGDHQRFGNHPQAKNVYDLDSVQLIQTLSGMRDRKKFISGDDFSGEAPLFIGAAANPYADPYEYRVVRLAKKAKAGVDFVQTQAVFDVAKFAHWMESVCERGLDKRVHILAGVIPVKSVAMARYMRDYVSGVSVPDEIITRLEKAQDVKEEGVKICLEIIEQVRDIPGVHGIHLMAVGWEDMVPTIVDRAGLLPRPLL